MSWVRVPPKADGRVRKRQLIFLRKSDCLGCAVLLCLVVCLTLLASFFLPSHLSLKHAHAHVHACEEMLSSDNVGRTLQ